MDAGLAMVASALTGTDRLRAIGRHATEGADTPWGALLLVAGFLVALVTLVSLRRLHARRDIEPGSRTAFLLMSRRLGLTWRQRMLLWRICRRTALSHPVSLLLAPSSLHDHARQFVAGMAMTRRDRIMRRVAAVERRLWEIERDPTAGLARISGLLSELVSEAAFSTADAGAGTGSAVLAEVRPGRTEESAA